VNLRILLVSEDIPHPLLGGLGKHVLALARELHHRGHEVDLLGNADHSVADLPTQAGPGRFIAGIRGHQRLFKEKQLGVFLPWRADWNARAAREAILREGIIAGELDSVGMMAIAFVTKQARRTFDRKAAEAELGDLSRFDRPTETIMVRVQERVYEPEEA
jgi:glycosyltransferase involved in cell wall biosynthesis